MKLDIKGKESRKYDLVSLGEVMLRLDPGEGRIRTARRFNAWEGGGEYNVARGLRKCFGMDAAIVTAFADNEIGGLLHDLILQGGVDTSFVKWDYFDGAGRASRNGLNFTERGFGLRGALGVSDRANTAVSQLKCGDIDWDEIFGKAGARWFHTGGIFVALSPTTAEVAVEALKSAKKYGVITSYDLNYRPSLWKSVGGVETAREFNREIVRHVDVCIGNEEDFTACLGFEIEGNDGLKKLNVEGYKKMVEAVSAEFSNIKVIASTLRTVHSATINDWTAVCYADNKVYTAANYDRLEILDRVGGGDSFASGLIYGFLTSGDPQKAVDYGCAHGALAMTTPGDTSMASLKEVEALVKGAGSRVQR